MKKLFFLATIAIMLVTAGCSKKNSSDPADVSQYVGTYYIASTGSLEYQTDSSKSVTIPIVLADTMNVSVDPANSSKLVCSGKIFKGSASVSASGMKIDDIVYEETKEGIAYGYLLKLTIANDYATKDALGLLSWKSTVTGTASGSTIGVGVEKSVTGTLTNIGVTKLF